MRCCYCEALLVCGECQRPYRPAGAPDYESLYRPEYPVVCPGCRKIVRCRACGATYSGSDEEYLEEPADG